ncbi:hypothetical protein ACFQ49_03495 [Kroppenstedtia eburnea]|uniref:Capsule polysaccharide biosynthesis protein n=1 Tax=Kroppenstedtia eburnea TaxID=714067 RepID=A0A1N7Q8G7_9BACL|nr:hypothetical protein [Kroppenstedtia eburnea]EGK12900.1 hypothetical protein HMPREF9374_1195 [Desmospora sp. 8437]QKI82601.1 hypothetical protein GXN75_11710 [Kroppenstedtia eburnea]SIT19135.1 hypothetical protein SAMN05421790_1213 [Kroppenstedtia eburnea]
MYGDDRLNNHYILRYGLTHEFFQAFHQLTHSDIEIPLTLVRYFHIWIKPFVNAQRTNDQYVQKLQKKHRFNTMKDVQKALSRGPEWKQSLPQVPQRKAILMPAMFAPLALECFHDENVILHVLSNQDRHALNICSLMENMSVYDIVKGLGQVHLSSKTRAELKARIEKLVIQNSDHELFGRPDFKMWLLAHSFRSAKMIDALDQLIRQLRIGVILDQVEITMTTSILSLLARKYGLPFINMPQVLITDRSLIPTRASHYYVWGENYKKWFQKRGIPSSKIKVIGNWKFELAKRNSQAMSRSEFGSRFGIPDTHHILTYTTQPLSSQVNQRVMEWIKQISPSFSVTFLIRQHPGASYDYSSALRFPNIVFVPSTLNLYHLLAITDILMTVSSNTAIEAAMLGKGVFVLQPPIQYDYEFNNNDFNHHLVKAGAGPSITSPTDMKDNLERLTTDKTYLACLQKQGKRFLQKTLQTNPPPSIQIKNLVKRLICNDSSVKKWGIEVCTDKKG